MRMGSRIKNKQSQFFHPQSVSINNTSATKAVQFIIAYQRLFILDTTSHSHILTPHR